MPLSLGFWILMLLWVVGVLYTRYPQGPQVYGFDLLLFVLLLILGWAAFGVPIRG